MSTVNTWGAVNSWVSGRAIVAVDNDNEIFSGQQSVVIDAVGLVPNSTIQAVDFEGMALPVVSWIEVSADVFEVTVNIPYPGSVLWGTSGTLSITDDTDTLVFSTSVSLSLPDNWFQKTYLGGAPEPYRHQSFPEQIANDPDADSYVMQVNDILFYEHPVIIDGNSPVMTLSDELVPVITPYGDVSGGYVVWKEAEQTYTGASTYEWIDGGSPPQIPVVQELFENPNNFNKLMTEYPLGDAPA